MARHGVAPFRFKHFGLTQADGVMRISTDAVLLGAWARVTSVRTLDVGTGTGVLPLMLAQRGATCIDAIDIEAQAVALATQNVATSPWAHHIAVHHCAFQSWAPDHPGHYGHIISNPPYFQHALQPPDPARAVAKHTVLLPHSDLLTSSLTCLAARGYISVILPAAEGAHIIAQAEEMGLHLNRILCVAARPGGAIRRVLCEFGTTLGLHDEQEMCLHDHCGHPTDAYKQLTRDFYLAF